MSKVREISEGAITQKNQLPVVDDNVKKQVKSVFSFAKIHCVNTDPENNRLMMGIIQLETYLDNILVEYNKLVISKSSEKAIKEPEIVSEKQ